MIEQPTRTPCYARVRSIGPLLVIVALAAPTLLAGEAIRSAPTADEPRGVRLRLDGARLMPRVSVAMESLSNFQHGVQPGVSLQDHMMFSEMSQVVRDGAKSVTRRAVRNYLFQAVNLDRGIDRVRADVRGSGVSSSRVRFKLGFHSGIPQVGVRTSVGQTSLRLRASADGELAVGFSNYRYERADISLGFDGDDTVTFHGRLGF